MFDHVADILNLAHQPAQKAALAKYTQLRRDVLNEYLDSLIKIGLINKFYDRDMKKMFYQITDQGVEYLNTWDRLTNLVNYELEAPY